MRVSYCKDCGKALAKDEVALTKKILDRNAKEFLCLECMSDILDCSVDDLRIKIDEFKEQGCTLFV